MCIQWTWIIFSTIPPFYSLTSPSFIHSGPHASNVMLLSLLLSLPLKFTLCYSYIQGCLTIHWIKLPEATHLKKLTPPEGDQMSIAAQLDLGTGLSNSSHSQAELLTVCIMCRSSTGIHSWYKFMVSGALSCPDIFSLCLSPVSGSYDPSCPNGASALPRRNNINAPIVAEHCRHIYFLHFGKLWLSALTTVYCIKKPLW